MILDSALFHEYLCKEIISFARKKENDDENRFHGHIIYTFFFFKKNSFRDSAEIL